MKLEPGLGDFYTIRRGNGSGLFYTAPRAVRSTTNNKSLTVSYFLVVRWCKFVRM